MPVLRYSLYTQSTVLWLHKYLHLKPQVYTPSAAQLKYIYLLQLQYILYVLYIF